MKGKRTDLGIKALIIEGLINGELGSDIAKKNGIHESTVSRIKDNDLQEVASETSIISDLVTRNNNLQSLADVLIQKMIESEDESITIAQLTSLRESTFKQNQLISGKATDIIGIDSIDIV